jgi:hypothetical protein
VQTYARPNPFRNRSSFEYNLGRQHNRRRRNWSDQPDRPQAELKAHWGKYPAVVEQQVRMTLESITATSITGAVVSRQPCEAHRP